MRPFEVDWTLRTIQEARNNNAACAALSIWIHKDKGAELMDELLSTLQKGGEGVREQMYELQEALRMIHRLEDKKGDFLIPIVLNPITGTRTVSTKGLTNSGCTSSAINRSFIEKHVLETKKVAAPVPVYNTDGT